MTRELELIFAGKVDHDELRPTKAAIARIIKAVELGHYAEAIDSVEMLDEATARNAVAVLALGAVGQAHTLAELADEVEELTAPIRAAEEAQELLGRGITVPRSILDPRRRR
jgi:hypothetical protein